MKRHFPGNPVTETIPEFKPGDLVQVRFNFGPDDPDYPMLPGDPDYPMVSGERMWVRLIDASICENCGTQYFTGTLDNEPIFIDPQYLKYGDTIEFCEDLITDWLEPDED